MAFSVEARVPFLDHDVVDIALSLPDRLRISPRQTKVGLRRAMRGVVPDQVLDRSDKIGFAPPQEAWLRATAERFTPLATQAMAEARGYLLPGAVGASIKAFVSGRLRDDDLWRVLNLELWLRIVAGVDPIPGYEQR